ARSPPSDENQSTLPLLIRESTIENGEQGWRSAPVPHSHDSPFPIADSQGRGGRAVEDCPFPGERTGCSRLPASRMILPLRMSLELRPVEVHRAKIPARVARDLVAEVWRRRITALASRRHRSRPHAVGELHDRYEAVPARAIPFLRVRIGPRTE